MKLLDESHKCTCSINDNLDDSHHLAQFSNVSMFRNPIHYQGQGRRFSNEYKGGWDPLISAMSHQPENAVADRRAHP